MHAHLGAASHPNVVKGMLQRGYSDEDVAKVIGGNFLRVFGQVMG